MKRQNMIRMGIDLAMVVLLPILMGFSLAGEKAHEVVGICMFALFYLDYLAVMLLFMTLGYLTMKAVGRKRR